MKLTEAYQILEVTPHSTEKEIKASYRKLSKEFHPDKNFEKSEKQKILNEAYEVIQAYLKISHSVIPIENNENLITHMEGYLIKAELRQDATNLSNKIYRRKKNKISILKYFSWSFALISAFLAFFSKEILPTIEISQDIQSLFKLNLFLFGGLSLLLQLVLQRIKIKLEDYTDNISNKKECAIELAELLSYRSLNEFSKEDLHSSSQDSLSFPFSLFLLRKDDFIELLILKAMEHNLISPISKDLTSLASFDKYTINFNPEIFQNKKFDKAEEPKTISDVRADMISSLLGSIILIPGSIALFYFVDSNWKFASIITILAGLGAILSYFDHKKEYKTMKTNIEQ